MTASLLLGGLFVLKSDRDYLLTLPLSRRDLSISLFIAQFVGTGITVLFLYGFYVAGTRDLTTTLVLVANLALFACVVTSLGVISNILEIWKRVAIAVGLGLWSLASLAGVPFTPVSTFTGNLVFGSIAMLALSAAVIPVALRELGHLELGSMRTLLRTTSSEYKKTMSFAGKGPVRTIYSYHLSFLELVGRMNIGGSTSYRTARIKTTTVFIISSIAATVYLILAGFPLDLSINVSSRVLRGAVFVIPVFMGVIVLLLIAQGTFSNERGWLAFTAMDPAKYLRHLVVSRVISTLAVIGPFGVADIFLGIMGNSSAFESALILLVTVPAASILATYLVARLGAVQQVKEEGMMPGQFDLRQFVVVLPVYVVIGLIILSLYVLLAGIVIAATLAILSILLFSRASAWRGLAYRLTERGFV